MDDFEEFWRKNYDELPPVSYQLKNQFFGTRWVRFHSLPDSKRYPDNEAEMDIVLERANALANRVLGIGAECWMVANVYSGYAEESIRQGLIRDTFGLRKSYTWKDPDEAPEDQVPFTTYVGDVVWRSSGFDEAIKRIAEDIESNILWVSKQTKSIFYPYDGGTDLIVRDSNQVKALKNEFSDWLPLHPDGL